MRKRRASKDPLLHSKPRYKVLLHFTEQADQFSGILEVNAKKNKLMRTDEKDENLAPITLFLWRSVAFL